jgi:GNAT superfamily N-acetyltransferase
VKYRRVNIEDIEDLVNFRIQFLNDETTHPNVYETKKLRMAIKQYFTWAIPSKIFICWIAEYEGRIVGSSGLVTWQIPGRFGFQSGKHGYILNMYTIPEMREKGVATHLLNKLIGEAKSIGIERLHLHARKAGLKLYRKMGFEEPPNPELEMRLN